MSPFLRAGYTSGCKLNVVKAVNKHEVLITLNWMSGELCAWFARVYKAHADMGRSRNTRDRPLQLCRCGKYNRCFNHAVKGLGSVFFPTGGTAVNEHHTRLVELID